ncbi:hypothetical protein ABZ070_29060 [Streptomyces sp. NPDC006283]|uniref:hypothetical protein n=1 Tax=Streptomyces sp. NPDC006283 TaxID=3156741 RepID=UPI0033AAF7EB
MTTSDAARRQVRRAIGLGRLLPLGGPADGAWLSERAAATVLRDAGATAVPKAALGTIRLSLVAPDAAEEPTVPAPPTALWPGPLRVEADVSVWDLEEPLPALTAALRAALFETASDVLGLAVTTVDLRVRELLDSAPEERPVPDAPAAVHPSDPAGTAAAATPGVAHLTATLGTAVHYGPDHVRVELATAPGHVALEVARAARSTVAAALSDDRAVTVVVTAVS